MNGPFYPHPNIGYIGFSVKPAFGAIFARDLSQKDCYPGGVDSFAETGRCAKSRCYPP
jgi:hypothetical protein